MQGSSFIFWLFNEAHKALYYDTIVREADDDNLKPDGQPARLEYSPDGWRDILVKYGRNIKYLGLFRDFTVPVDFKRDGAMIVKDAMWRKGMESILYLAINKLNRRVYPARYEPWYAGELDLSKIKQKKASVSVNVMEGGLSKYLKAFESTTYEIEVDGNSNADLVVMDGLPFTNVIQYTILDGQKIYSGFNVVEMGTISQEGSTEGILNQDTMAGTLVSYPNDQWFMSDESKYISVHITGQFILDVKNDGGITISVERRDDSGARVEMIILYQNLTTYSGDKIAVDVDKTITFEPNETLYMIASGASTSVAVPRYLIRESELKITYDVTFKQTTIKALKPIILLKKIVEKMTEWKYTAKSEYLEQMTEILITSGSAIRNHEGSSPTVTGSLIKTSLDEFFQAMRIQGIGLDIEDQRIVIERTSYFFQPDIALELGEVNDFQIEVAEDLVFNTIKVGYANQTYDEVNGKDEFNVTQNYTTPFKRIVKELDLVSPYRADAYGIELTRLNLDGKDTTDNSADNDTFFLSVAKGGTINYYRGQVEFNTHVITIPENLSFMTGETIMISGVLNAGTYVVTNTSYIIAGSTLLSVAETLTVGSGNVIIDFVSATLYKLLRLPYSSVTGILHPDMMFNIELSPKRKLYRNSDFIHSVLDFEDSEEIKFQSGEKNSELSTTLFGKTISESANIEIGSLPKKLFRPYYFSFNVPTDFNFLKTIEAKKYSRIGFMYNSVKYYGYLFDGGVQPATRDVQTIKLLCAGDIDVSKLINIK